ncbi:MAG TPA: glycosyltransferase [Bacteroidales bacterium]|nr:glycosyltransferase [Bacteroidales bacterium]
MKKIAVFQEIITDYRVDVFNKLGEQAELTVLYAPSTRIKNAKTFDPAKVVTFNACQSSVLKFFGGRMTFHPGMIRWIRRNRPPVLITEGRAGILTNWVIGLLFPRMKVVFWLSGHLPEDSRWKSRARRLIRKIYLQRADAFLCYGTATQAYLESLGINRPSFIAYNSMDTDAITRDIEEIKKDPGFSDLKLRIRNGKRLVLLFIGRIIPAKNLDSLLLAVAQLTRSNRPDLRLICIGDGPELENLRRLSEKLDISSHLEFTGAIYDRKTLTAYCLSSDVFVLPGAGGLALNHAIACGMPAVVCEADGTEKDLVSDGHNGYYFRKKDQEDLAGKIGSLYEDPESIRRMSQNSFEISRKVVNVHTMIRGFLDVIG